MIGVAIGAAGVAIWLYLLIGRDGFWLARDTDEGAVTDLAAWPAVAIVVPARDEAAVIGTAIASLLGQDYPGDFRVILVDDGSSDGTAAIARAAAGDQAARLEIVRPGPPPRGWTGKLAAVAAGIDHAPNSADWLWLTDADIAHAPDTLRRLVARAASDNLVLNSAMAELRCDSFAERALVPAFVFFFQMLYPFAAVNRGAVAAAAGGSMLVDRAALAAAGGMAVIAGAIIDDCALAALLRRQGRLRLALTRRSVSIRAYGGWRDIGAMVARSAFAQLGYSSRLLAATLAGMALVYLAPPLLAGFAGGAAGWLGLLAWAMMALAFQPMLRFYRRSPLWGIALPAIAAFYAAATLWSAVRHWQGRGGAWKGRFQAGLEA